MPPQAELSSLEAFRIATPSGPLELLACLPHLPTGKQPILCVHGAHCAAACFKTILPLLARAGYASYALSFRGHGQSWQPSTFTFHFLTSINSYVADLAAGIDFLATKHPDTAPILVGHSMGGGVLQRALTVWESQRERPAGLVLLASAPLSGGGLDVARNWQAAEAALAQQAQQAQQTPSPSPTGLSPSRATRQAWYPWLLSFFTINTGVDTPAQVRNKFFSPDSHAEVVQGWIRDSKSRFESIRVSIETFWPIAEPVAVLAAIKHDDTPFGRKILCISAERDVLIQSDVSRDNFDAYRSACQGEDEVLHIELLGSAHHIMLDIAHERCAEIITNWLQGESV
ncbi:hypothetical protein N0V90_009431 [Kalmusia sp. IMI 367209]|nr:hypothetical protein N0V90_009431 [Kalmusia sp. IMI 367209]